MVNVSIVKVGNVLAEINMAENTIPSIGEEVWVDCEQGAETFEVTERRYWFKKDSIYKIVLQVVDKTV